MPTLKHLALVVAFVPSLVGCWTTRANVSDEELGFVPVKAAAGKTYTDVGAVKATSVYWLFSSCEHVAKVTADKLLDQAQLLGGDAVTDVQYYGYDPSNPFERPTCWVTLGPLAVLVPWGVVVEASGRAVKVEAGKKGKAKTK